MRLTRIEFKGYKRLLDTGCNVDAHLIAFVGPNEAGKSTVLEALAWHTAGEELPTEKINRTIGLDESGEAPRVEGGLVIAEYVLSSEDKRSLASIDCTELPTRLRLRRKQDGSRVYSFHPRLARPTANAERVMRHYPASSLHTEAAHVSRVESAAATLAELASSGREWSDDDHAACSRTVEWLRRPNQSAEDRHDGDEQEVLARFRKVDAALADSLEEWQAQMRRPAPEAACWEALGGRVPVFLLFGAEHRVLSDTYNLASVTVRKSNGPAVVRPHDDVTDPPPALVSLLRIGGTSTRELYDLLRANDRARIQRRQREVNEALKVGISPYWQQARLTVEINLDGTMLQLYIFEEGPDGQVSLYTERSDGFRTFLTLILFLAEHRTEVPPILLIDEADTHLHYDAQADLVNYLLALDARTIYTTHSPGCLPPDMGTGIRLVRPSVPGISVLRNDFWTGEEPGLSPLLFAMGAGAAALSRFRAAVFTEGASDMMLLPTLLRLGTKSETIPYQIVPGLSNALPDQLSDLSYVAVRVAYLVDGDQGGDEHVKRLTEAGIDKNKIKQLKRGWATEDLIDPDQYIAAFNAVLADSGRQDEALTLADLAVARDAGTPIAKAAEDAIKPKKAPGKVAVAARLLQEPDAIRLSKTAAATLRRLHKAFLELLELQPLSRSS